MTKKLKLKMDLLKYLLDDPAISINKLAEKLGIYWRTADKKKKDLEDDHVIWGYTTVADEQKLGRVIYLALFKLKPITKDLPDLIIKKLTERKDRESGIRLINILYTQGAYGCILMFSAPDRAAAKMYYETIRVVFRDHFFDPLLLDVNFSLLREGKLNPELTKLYDFIPETKEEETGIPFFCGSCRAILEKGDKYCWNCGVKFVKPTGEW